MTESSIDLVIFDLGGVLIDPGGVASMRELARIDNDEELWRRWLGCRWVAAFESGRCSAEDFATGVVDDWDLTISPDAFLQEFGSWMGDPYAGSTELLDLVRTERPVACLSNMNELHWESHFNHFPIVHEFDYRFLSFELGQVKPNPVIFDLVAERLPVPRDRALFLDDNAVNVDAAIAAGFVAQRAQGVEAARRALVDAGVLRP